MTQAADRAASLAGATYPLLAVGGLLLAGGALPADFTAPPEEVAAHLSAHPPALATWVGLGLEGLALLGLVVFAVQLAARMGGWLAASGAALAGVAVAIKGGSVVPVLVAVSASDGLAAADLALLFRLNDLAVPVSETVLGGALLLLGTAGRLTGRVPRWIAIGALVAGTATVVDVAGGPGLLSLVGLAWFLAAGTTLAGTTRTGEPAAVAP